MSNKKNKLTNVREIGPFKIFWEEPSEKNHRTPYLIIKAASGQWVTKIRGDISTVVMWRRLLEEPEGDDLMLSQLRMMHVFNTTMNGTIMELFVQLIAIGNAYMIEGGKTSKEIDTFNDKRLAIAEELKKLTESVEPKVDSTEVTNKERKILNEMREDYVNKEIIDEEENQTSDLPSA